MKAKILFLVVLFFVSTTGCLKEEIQNTPSLKSATVDYSLKITSEFLNELNMVLADQGANFRVLMVETITNSDDHEMGQTIIAKNVGNKQLTADFVAGDPRRVWSGNEGTEITYAIDLVDAVPLGNAGLTVEQTTGAILDAFNIWNTPTCSDMGLTYLSSPGYDIGYIAWLVGNGYYTINAESVSGGSPYIFADIQHAGWGNIDFYGGTLAATFTFVFVSQGVPTDINEDGKADVAFREVYYDNSWQWTVPELNMEGIDIETVAAHEIGHCLSQGHFGKVFWTKTGDVQFAPRALMNAVYGGVLTELLGTDIAGHCGIWDNWPYE